MSTRCGRARSGCHPSGPSRPGVRNSRASVGRQTPGKRLCLPLRIHTPASVISRRPRWHPGKDGDRLGVRAAPGWLPKASSDDFSSSFKGWLPWSMQGNSGKRLRRITSSDVLGKPLRLSVLSCDRSVGIVMPPPTPRGGGLRARNSTRRPYKPGSGITLSEPESWFRCSLDFRFCENESDRNASCRVWMGLPSPPLLPSSPLLLLSPSSPPPPLLPLLLFLVFSLLSLSFFSSLEKQILWFLLAGLPLSQSW